MTVTVPDCGCLAIMRSPPPPPPPPEDEEEKEEEEKAAAGRGYRRPLVALE